MGIRTEAKGFSLIEASKKFQYANSIIPRNVQWPLYIIALLISDAATIFAAFWLAYLLRFELLVEYFDPRGNVSFDTYRFLLYSMPFLWLAIFALNGLYINGNLLGGTGEYSKIFRSASEGFLLIVLAGFLSPTLIIARGWLLMTWASTFLLVAAARFVLRRVVYGLRHKGSL